MDVLIEDCKLCLCQLRLCVQGEVMAQRRRVRRTLLETPARSSSSGDKLALFARSATLALHAVRRLLFAIMSVSEMQAESNAGWS